MRRQIRLDLEEIKAALIHAASGSLPSELEEDGKKATVELYYNHPDRDENRELYSADVIVEDKERY